MAFKSSGRPCELTQLTIDDMRKLFINNIPATKAAKELRLSRQRVYYYYKMFTANGVERVPQPTVKEILENVTA